MKLSKAIEKGKDKHWLSAQIRRNPSTRQQWFIMLVNIKQQIFMLADDDEDKPILSEDLNEFIELMKKIGIREFTVFL